MESHYLDLEPLVDLVNERVRASSPEFVTRSIMLNQVAGTCINRRQLNAILEAQGKRMAVHLLEGQWTPGEVEAIVEGSVLQFFFLGYEAGKRDR